MQQSTEQSRLTQHHHTCLLLSLDDLGAGRRQDRLWWRALAVCFLHAAQDLLVQECILPAQELVPVQAVADAEGGGARGAPPSLGPAAIRPAYACIDSEQAGICGTCTVGPHQKPKDVP